MVRPSIWSAPARPSPIARNTQIDPHPFFLNHGRAGPLAQCIKRKCALFRVSKGPDP
jgi:hypothetical protein